MAGTLPHEPSNIKKWVEANGGKWSARVAPHVTHLITGKDAWKKVSDPVMQAAERNIFIVTYDWLEDSLQKKRKLAEKNYTWEAIRKDRKRAQEIRKLGKVADGKKFIEGCKSIKELTGSGTSPKLPRERKPKPSKSHFFGATINTKFVSAADDLKRRRAEREAAEAVDRAAKERAARKADFAASGTSRTPIELENDRSVSGVSSMPKPPASVSPTRTTSSSTLPACVTTTTSPMEPQAKKSLKDLYHYYLDSTGFEYKVTLARSNFASNNITRYQISILESHTTPHTYCTFVQYTPPAGTRPDSSSSAPTTTNLRNPLLAFLKQANDDAKTQQPNTPTPTAQSEAAHLRSLITPTLPTTNLPYKSLITPISSPFPIVWRAFRHTFRDLTLLSWEERFDPGKSVQKARAQVLGLEPYVYAKPSIGMPMGLMVQEAGLGTGAGVGGVGVVTAGNGQQVIVLPGDAEDGYMRNEFRLPGVDEPLSSHGVIGAMLWREDEEVRKKGEAAEKKKEEKEEAERRRKGEAKWKKEPAYSHSNLMFKDGAVGVGYAGGNRRVPSRDMASYSGKGKGWGFEE